MIKPIKTRKDYETALKRVDGLLEAKKGTDAFDELEEEVVILLAKKEGNQIIYI